MDTARGPAGHTGPLPSHMYFFYDSEGSGGSAMRDHMIEVAVVLYTGNLGLEEGTARRLGSECFSSLCQCGHDIEPEVQQKHGIGAQALVGQPTVLAVLTQLFEWVQDKVREVQNMRKEQCTAVLVSHGGSAFDFPLLVTEVKRSGCEAMFKALQLQFADTHTLCEKLRARRDPVLQGGARLALTNLHTTFFPAEQHKPHRALSDAQALRKLFTETPLINLLHTLDLVSTDSLMQKWCSYMECQELTLKLGLQKQKAKELIQRQITLGQLEREFQGNSCSEQWLRRHLRSLGIRPREACLGHFRRLVEGDTCNTAR